MADNSGKATRVIWDSETELRAVYANHLSVSHTGGSEFHLVFGHLSPPLLANMAEEEIPDVVKIKPVAEIVLSPKVMKAFLRVLNDNFERFEKSELESE